MSVLHFLYLAGPYPWNVGNVWFTFTLCVITLCMMYVYLYLLVYGWLCTLYDGLLWLREHSLVVRALDLVVWVCAWGNCRRCIILLYCVHDHRGVIGLIYVTMWHQFPRVCDMYQHVLTLWRASACHGVSMSIRVTYTNAKPYRCAIAHQMWNSAKFSPWKIGYPHCCILTSKAWWE